LDELLLCSYYNLIGWKREGMNYHTCRRISLSLHSPRHRDQIKDANFSGTPCLHSPRKHVRKNSLREVPEQCSLSLK
jgi:hypothetical protein